MNRYFIRIAFNGSPFHGWQIQENAHSVQAELNQALANYLGHPVNTTGCGRTDTGVHALMFYAHFDTEKKILNSRQFLYKINKMLPATIACYELRIVDEKLHARFDAVSRTYQYFVTRIKDPFLKDTAYYLYGNLDIVKMNSAANVLPGYSDFSAFSKSGGADNKTCNVHLAEWNEEENMLIFTITANRFLRNMVRSVVGTLLEIGQNKMDPSEIHYIIQSGDRSRAGFSVPAHGLFLTEVQYREGAFG